MDSQLSLFGFEEAPSDKKEEVKAKSTTKKQAAKDAAPEISLFGESVSDDVPSIENDAPNNEVTEEINNDIVEQEEDVNTAASVETVFPTTENYSISEDEYQQLDENSEDEFPWEEQVLPEEEIYTDTQIENENFAADDNVEDHYTEDPTIYISEEDKYIEPNPEFENEISDIAVEETELNSEDEIIADEPLENTESFLKVTENTIEGENISDEELPVKQEDSFSDTELTNEVTEVEPEDIAPIPQFELEESQEKTEEDLTDIEDEASDISDKNEEDALQIENHADSLNNYNESEGFKKETEPEYIEPIPQFESEDNLAEYEKDLTEAEETSDELKDENPLIEEQTQSDDNLLEAELNIDYPAFWDEKIEEEKIPELIVEAKDLFGETIVTPNKNTFKAGKRGRKSFKEIDAEVDLIDVPEDDLLFSKQYYPISEVAKWFRVNNSLLRFWENEFDILKPRKNRKGDRLFRPEDIKNLQVIYYLLRNKKYTIEGAKKYLKTNKKTADINLQIIHALNNFKSFLLELKVNAS